MRKPTVIVTLVALATLVVVVLLRRDPPPVAQPPEAPAEAAISPVKTEQIATQPVPAPAPTPPVPAPPAAPSPEQEGTPDSPGDPLAQQENPSEQFMHSRRGDGQHSE